MLNRGSEAVPLKIGKPYLLALLGSVLISLLLRIRINYLYIVKHGNLNLALNRFRDLLLSAHGILVIVFFYLLIRYAVPYVLTQRPLQRRFLFLIGLLASFQLFASVVSVNISIYRLHVESYSLLMESLALYVGTNLVFIFWYWFFDYPLKKLIFSQDEVEVKDIPQGILFPEELIENNFFKTEAWTPGLIDYVYFTILSSNCFGSPEGHMLIGESLKKIQIIHTLSMILIFIVIVARAINTLN